MFNGLALWCQLAPLTISNARVKFKKIVLCESALFQNSEHSREKAPGSREVKGTPTEPAVSGNGAAFTHNSSLWHNNVNN